MFEHLVDQQYFSATFLKFVGEVYNAVAREIEVVHVDEQTGTVVPEFLFGVLEKESGFSYATCPFDTNQTVTLCFSGGKYTAFFRICKVEMAKLCV